jgi:pimeloyl-ACP methyl ester carboxylesterase
MPVRSLPAPGSVIAIASTVSPVITPGSHRAFCSSVVNSVIGQRSFRDAPRTGMLRAMESVMLNRPDITPQLSGVEVPTLMVAPRNDRMLTVEQVRTAVDRMPHGAMVELDADGHVAPILERADELADAITAFWRDPKGFIAR